MANRRRERGGLAADVASLNETPLQREWYVEYDTGRGKIGDGVTPYNSLPYLGEGGVPLTSLFASYSNDLAGAVTSIGSNKVSLFINADVTVSANVTVPSNVSLVFLNGAKITVNSGKTLTINSPFDLGNVLCFAGAGDVKFGQGTIDGYRTAWWTGPTPEQDIATAFTRALASIASAHGGRILIPQGRWQVSSGITITNAHSFLSIEGEGTPAPNTQFGPELQFTGAGRLITIDGTFISMVRFRNLNLNANDTASIGSRTKDAVVVRDSSGAGAFAGGLFFESVIFENARYGFLADLDGITGFPTPTLQLAQTTFDRKTRFTGCETSVRCSTSNTDVQFEANIESPGSGIGVKLDRAGKWKFIGTEFAGTASGGANQSLKNTVIGAVTVNGNAKCVVTKAGMAGSPLTIVFPVNTVDHPNASAIALAAAKALAANATIIKNFNVGVVGADVYQTCLDAAANDGTMALQIANDTCSGITTTNSTATLAGAAYTFASTTAVEIAGGVDVAFIGTQDEGFQNSLNITTTSFADLVRISCRSATMQGRIFLGACHLTMDKCFTYPKSIRDQNHLARLTMRNCWCSWTAAPQSGYNLETRPTDIVATTAGTSAAILSEYPSNALWSRDQDKQMRGLTVFRPGAYSSSLYTDAWFKVLARNDVFGGRQMFLGAGDDNGNPTFGYDLYRDITDGLLHIEGNQASPFNGLSLTGTLAVASNIASSGGLSFPSASPASFGTDQNDYNPGSKTKFIRLTTSAAVNLTGFTANASNLDGQQILLVNVGANNITLKHENTGSAANHRFHNSTGADIVLSPDQAADLIYDLTTARWRAWKKN